MGGMVAGANETICAIAVLGEPTAVARDASATPPQKPKVRSLFIGRSKA
jgi:hypothetical protein